VGNCFRRHQRRTKDPAPKSARARYSWPAARSILPRHTGPRPIAIGGFKVQQLIDGSHRVIVDLQWIHLKREAAPRRTGDEAADPRDERRSEPHSVARTGRKPTASSQALDREQQTLKSIDAQLDFIESRGIGECICRALPQLAGNFDDICCSRRHGRTLMLPDLPSHRGDGIGEGAV